MILGRTKKTAVLLLFMGLPSWILYEYSGQSTAGLLVFIAFVVAGISHLFGWDKYLVMGLLASVFFSVDTPVLGGNNLAIPAEPLAVLLAISGVYALVFDTQWRSVLEGLFPIKILLVLVGVFLVTSVFSSMPKVSFKYTLVWVTYILSGLTLARVLYYKEVSIQVFLWILGVSLTLIGAFSIYNLMPYQFNPGAAPIMAKPFFKDHTVLSATFSLLGPLFLFWPKGSSKTQNHWFTVMGGFLILVIFISSSRAAWLSVLLCFPMYGILKLRVKPIFLVLFTLPFLALIWISQREISNAFLVNPYQSSHADSSIEDQALSVTNVNSDPSNLERINRWKCALRMFESKPIMGFGPGTYQFQYFPFQREEDMTYISVTSPFLNKQGRGGSAHSEYLLLLSETGVFSFLLWISLWLWIFIETFREVTRSGFTNSNQRLVAVFLGLFTYGIHSALNNYLNVAVFGIPFWILIFVFIYHHSLQSHGKTQ